MIRNAAVVALAMLPLLLTSVVFRPAIGIALFVALFGAWTVRGHTLPWSIAGIVNALLGLLFLVSIWGMAGAPITSSSWPPSSRSVSPARAAAA